MTDERLHELFAEFHRHLDMRFDAIEQRVSGMTGALSGLEAKIDALITRLDRLEKTLVTAFRGSTWHAPDPDFEYLKQRLAARAPRDVA